MWKSKLKEAAKNYHRVGALFVIACVVLIAGAAYWEHASVAARVDAIQAACGETQASELRFCYGSELEKLLSEGMPTMLAVVHELYGRGLEKACHYALHPVGAAAYRQYRETGNNVFQISDAAMCNFGFYHGFVIALMNDTGDVLDAKHFCDSLDPKLVAEKPEVRDECYHGVGHAMVTEAVGEPLNEKTDPLWVERVFRLSAENGISECRRIFSEWPALNNCNSGVYHELAMLQTADGWYSDPSDPLWLCEEADPAVRGNCYGNMHRVFVKVFPGLTAREIVPRIERLYGTNQFMTAMVVRWYGHVRGLVAVSKPEEFFRFCRDIPDEYQKYCLSGGIGWITQNGEGGEEYKASMEFCMRPELSREERQDCVDEAFGYFEGMYNARFVRSLCARYDSLGPRTCEKQSFAPSATSRGVAAIARTLFPRF